jgi:hypothetical protein
VAEALLAGAMAADQGRPQDDMSVVALALLPIPDNTLNVRTLDVLMPADL